MGVYQDLLDNGKTIRTGNPLYQFLVSQIVSKVDPVVSAAAAANAVQSWATSTQTSGNATLTFTFRNGETFTTGNILFSAAAATIESAIDSAATAASITGWTNGDISVSGGAVNVAPTVFTFDGTSMAGTSIPAIVVNDVDGAGGAWGAVTRTTSGQTARYAWGVLEALGVVSGSYPDQEAAESATAFTVGANPDFNQIVVRMLAREAVEEDDNFASYFSVLTTLGINQDRAPLQNHVS